MDEFLMRMGRHMNSEELLRYSGLLAPDFASALFMEQLARHFQSEVDAAVDMKMDEVCGDLFRDEIATKFEEAEELVDATEEAVYPLLLRAPYGEGSEQVGALFEKLREDMKALLPKGEVKKA